MLLLLLQLDPSVLLVPQLAAVVLLPVLQPELDPSAVVGVVADFAVGAAGSWPWLLCSAVSTSAGSCSARV